MCYETGKLIMPTNHLIRLAPMNTHSVDDGQRTSMWKKPIAAPLWVMHVTVGPSGSNVITWQRNCELPAAPAPEPPPEPVLGIPPDALERRWALQRKDGRILLEGVAIASHVAGAMRRTTMRIDRRAAERPAEIAPLLEEAWRRRDELGDAAPVRLALRRLKVVPHGSEARCVGRPLYLDEQLAYLTFEVPARDWTAASRSR